MKSNPGKRTIPRAPKGGCYCNGRFYKGGQFLPSSTSRRQAQDVPDDLLIHSVLAMLPTSVEAAQAMHRYLRGRPTNRDKAIIDSRRLAAIETLRERSATQQEWIKWNDRYVAVAGGLGMTAAGKRAIHK